VFGAELVTNATFRAAVTGKFTQLYRDGVATTLAANLAKG
jgi:hypothetical protein